MRVRRATIAGIALIALAIATTGLRALARARRVQVAGTLVWRAERSDKVVALTFDDGPARAPLDTILATLAARGVHATFFVIGAGIAESPGVAERLVAAGHELGNHTYSHQHMVFKSPATIRSEVERTDSLIRRAGHAGPIYFRPPYSYKLFGLPLYLRRTGRTTITWDLEPESFPEVAATSAGIVRYVLDRVQPGSIVLLHVWYRGGERSRAAVGPLIDSLQARGYRVTTVRDLLAHR
jgi:peptidoglycan-N-acetylglucosamine deacetylase